MWYLIEQYVWFLLAAFAIGVVVGWITTGRPVSGK